MNVYKIGKATIQTNDAGLIVAVNKHGLQYFYEDITDVIKEAKAGTIKRIEHAHEQLPVSDLPTKGREGFARYGPKDHARGSA